MHVLLHMINLALQTSLDNTSEEIQQSYICTCAFAKLASMMQPIRCKTGQCIITVHVYTGDISEKTLSHLL